MEEQLLQQIADETKREARFSRITACVIACILAILVIAMLVLIPRAVRMMGEIEQAARDAQTVMTQASETLQSLSGAMGNVEEMTDSLTKTSTTLFDGIGKVDFDALAKAVTDLQEAVEPMANFARMLGRM